MRQNMDCIYLSAGMGHRLDKSIPKQLLRIGGKPIMIYSLEKIVGSGFFDKIIITYPRSFLGCFKEVISNYFTDDSMFEYVEGSSKTRQESVWNALKKVESDKVVIHEAARPLLSKKLLERVVLSGAKCVTPVITIPFTVVGGEDRITQLFKRDELKNVQLPQKYDVKILRESHKKTIDENMFFTDDSTLVYYYGNDVTFIDGEEINIKITTKEDLKIMGLMLFKSLEE